MPELSAGWQQRLQDADGIWLVTGVAGFIGSNILERLLRSGQRVVGLDNFSMSGGDNLAAVKGLVSPGEWSNFELIEGDIRDYAVCRAACSGARYVLHQAAIASVPLSIRDPEMVNEVNVNGFINAIEAARAAAVDSFVYASSSAVYGECTVMPVDESLSPTPISPYGLTKWRNEEIARDLFSSWEFNSTGLRYFNVYGKYQSADSGYAAVIPK